MKKADKLQEIEETDEIVEEKCKKLADLLRWSKCTVVYTGAGISTAASIPDYRGPNGVWTLAERGILVPEPCDPVRSNPTTSHMVLKEMYRLGIVQHIVSQNCDGFHLRSGLPQKMLSEIHGNMHIEVCPQCKPPRQFIRPFDVTTKSEIRQHRTGRYCIVCNSELCDTIVHMGESGHFPWPLNWKGIHEIIVKCDLILCIGSSLGVLKHYENLWPKPGVETQIVIVNLQWTPKDRLACLKISAKCDKVLEKVADLLNIPILSYCRTCDPILNPRRNARIKEIMERLTDCTCDRYIRRNVLRDECSRPPAGSPGWWSAGIQMFKQISQVNDGTMNDKLNSVKSRSKVNEKGTRTKISGNCCIDDFNANESSNDKSTISSPYSQNDVDKHDIKSAEWPLSKSIVRKRKISFLIGDDCSEDAAKKKMDESEYHYDIVEDRLEDVQTIDEIAQLLDDIISVVVKKEDYDETELAVISQYSDAKNQKPGCVDQHLLHLISQTVSLESGHNEKRSNLCTDSDIIFKVLELVDIVERETNEAIWKVMP